MSNPITEMKELLTEESWIKGVAHQTRSNGTEQYCLVGARDAVARVDVPTYEWLRTRMAIGRCLQKAIRTFGVTESMADDWEPSISGWNDRSERTFADIQGVLDIAEKQWEADHE